VSDLPESSLKCGWCRVRCEARCNGPSA